MERLNVDTLHHAISGQYPKPYSFRPEEDLSVLKERIRERYRELVKLPEKNFTATAQICYEDNSNELYDEIRFEVETEPNFFVPCHMLLPKNRKAGEKLPTVICLQGHSSGMHISLGRKKFPKDDCGGDRDFAIQAVSRGYIAVAMDQRGLGELKSRIDSTVMCHQLAFECLMTGRVLQGERIHDVRCLVDALEGFEAVDMDRLAIMGNSGGGTTSYHAMVLEPRIKVSMPSCSFCTYEDSILAMVHCACNFVPGISTEMEMADLAMAIAPRPLVIVNGDKDPIFPLEAAKRSFEIVKEIYKAAGAPENCRHIIGDGAHRFFAADAWPVFAEYI